MIVGLFRTILILVAVYYIIRFINRFLFEQQARKQREDMIRSSKKNEGKVTIQRKHSGGGKKEEDDDGDYIDFEEISDDNNTLMNE